MKTTITHKLNSLLAVAPAAALLILAAGNTAPMCGSIEPSMQQVCDSAADCTGLPHADCDGTWSCENDQCSFSCLPDVPEKVLCLVDEQCGKGEHCSLSDGDCNLEVFCPKGAENDDLCTVECLGECVEDEPTTGCQSDDDCAEGEVCQLTDCAAPKCAAGAPCPLMCEPVGQCVPEVIPDTCDTDSDCPAGMMCQLDTVCDAFPCDCKEGADCMCASPCFTQGTCVPAIPGDCHSDGDCPAGYICAAEVVCAACEACGDNMECGCKEECFETSMCVPVPPPSECGSDIDCGPGFICEFLCGAVDCAPGSDCAPEYCPGVCVPSTEPGECFVDADCPAGFFCEMLYEGYKCGGSESGDKCMGPGVCMPIEEPLYCVDDSECPTGMICSADPNSFCYGGDSNDGAEQDAMFCMGICVPAGCGDIACADGFEPDPQTCKCVPVTTQCVVGGCSGELCVAAGEPVASTCIWLDYYECFSPELTSCGPFGPGGTCMWEPTAALYACLEKFF